MEEFSLAKSKSSFREGWCIFICTEPISLCCMCIRYKKTFSDSEPSFNAGLWGMNFDLWRKQEMKTEVEYWMQQVSPCSVGVVAF